MKNMLTNFSVGQHQFSTRTILYVLASCSLLVSIQLSSVSIALIVVHALITSPIKESKQFLKRNALPLFLYLGFFILFLISLSYSKNLNLGWKDIESKLSLVLLPLAIFSQKEISKKEISVILKCFSIFTLFCGILAILFSFLNEGRLLTNQELSAQIGIHASYFSLYLLLSIAVFVQEAIQASKLKALYLAFSIIGFILLLLLASRIIILSTFLVAGVYIFFFNYSKGKILIFIFSILALVLTIIFVPSVKTRFVEAIDFSDRVELDADINEHRTLGRNFGGRAIRVAIWTCSMDVVEENWLFGVGAGDVHEHLQQSYKDHVFEFAYKYNNYNAHNLYIETLIAVGVLGLLLVLSLFFLLVKKALNQRNVIFLTFVLSFVMLSIMESSFNVHRGIVYFTLFSCLILNTNPVKGYK